MPRAGGDVHCCIGVKAQSVKCGAESVVMSVRRPKVKITFLEGDDRLLTEDFSSVKFLKSSERSLAQI